MKCIPEAYAYFRSGSSTLQKAILQAILSVSPINDLGLPTNELNSIRTSSSKPYVCIVFDHVEQYIEKRVQVLHILQSRNQVLFDLLKRKPFEINLFQ